MWTSCWLLFVAIAPLVTGMQVHARVPSSSMEGTVWFGAITDADTLDWRGYFPLDIGNEWEYHDSTGICGPNPLGCRGSSDRYRMRVEYETFIQEHPYYALVRYRENAIVDTVFVRYDERTASVLVRHADGGEGCFLYGILCDLDVAIDSLFRSSSTLNTQRLYRRLSLSNPPPPPEEIVPGGDPKGKNVAGEYFELGSRLTGRLVHGIGPTYLVAVGCTYCRYGNAVLRFASIGGITYGTPTITIPTEIDRDLSDIDFGFWPNPVRGRLTVRLPAPATLEVFDLMGRSLFRTISPSGGEVGIDLTGLAPGPYLLRAGDHSTMFIVF